MKIASKKRVLSLFTGCGGMDLGFEGDFYVRRESINEKIYPNWIAEEKGNLIRLPRTNYEITFANDILQTCKISWSSYFSRRGYNKDIFRTDSIVDLVKAAQNGSFIFPQNIDVVTGGFPCQDFSTAGYRKGFNSHKSHRNEKIESLEEATEANRGQLYIWMREVIKLVKPSVFIAENVKGLISLGDAKTIIENDFRDIDNKGFLVVPARVLSAADYGVPQRRERIIFIGFNKRKMRAKAILELQKNPISEKYDPYPSPTHYNFNHKGNDQLNIFLSNTLLKPYVSTKHVLSGLKEPSEEKDDFAQMFYSKAAYCPNTQGQTEIDPNFISPTIRAEHHGNIEYRRLSVEKGGKNIEELNSGLEERRLTVRECARLQTFPDDYVFVHKGNKGDTNNLSVSSGYKLVGNAVPPLLAYHIAKRLEKIWFLVFK